MLKEFEVIVCDIEGIVHLQGESLLKAMQALSTLPDFDEESVEYKVCVEFVRNFVHDYNLESEGVPTNSSVRKIEDDENPGGIYESR